MTALRLLKPPGTSRRVDTGGRSSLSLHVTNNLSAPVAVLRRIRFRVWPSVQVIASVPRVVGSFRSSDSLAALGGADPLMASVARSHSSRVVAEADGNTHR